MSDRKALVTYGEIVEVLEELPAALRVMRRLRGLSTRAAAEEIGVSFVTISRFEQGRDADSGTLLAILSWLYNQEQIEPATEERR